MGISEVFNMDNMEGMKRFTDKYFDLAVVDPPYGIGGHKQRVFNDGKKWDNNIPTDEYFTELIRVSKNQIVCGGNYFKQLWPCKGFIIWDKHQPDGLTFAMVELATCSINNTAKMFFAKPAGERGFYTVDSKRIHPTQKPIALYDWIYEKYLPSGGKVLDTHLGSGSNRISAYKRGNIDFTGYELDTDYFNDQEKRFLEFKQSFDPASLEPITSTGQVKLF
jgi:site-specific DNA-methyltransferase (adenine-specific)